MRKGILVLFACLFSLPFLATESDSSVVFRASFLKHELQRYEISRAVYTLQKGDTVSLERIRFIAEIYVMDSTDAFYTLSWKFSKFSINTDDQQLKQLIAMAKPVEITYRISKPGVLSEFLKWKEITTCLDEALPKVLAPYISKSGAEAKAEVARIYEMRETLETLMLRSVHQFHQVYGLGYTLGESVDVPTEVQSRFSSVPIKGIIRKKMIRIDKENHLAVLSTATFLDRNEFQKALSGYLQVDSIPITSLNQENTGGIVVDLSTGWILWSFDQREGRAGNAIYGEIIEIQPINETSNL